MSSSGLIPKQNAILQHPTTTQPEIHWASMVCQVWIPEAVSAHSPARFFRMTTTPLPSAAGSMPTVLRWMRPLKRKAFLAFRLFGSWKKKSESNDYLICSKTNKKKKCEIFSQMSNTEKQQCSKFVLTWSQTIVKKETAIKWIIVHNLDNMTIFTKVISVEIHGPWYKLVKLHRFEETGHDFH